MAVYDGMVQCLEGFIFVEGTAGSIDLERLKFSEKLVLDLIT